MVAGYTDEFSSQTLDTTMISARRSIQVSMAARRASTVVRLRERSHHAPAPSSVTVPLADNIFRNSISPLHVFDHLLVTERRRMANFKI